MAQPFDVERLELTGDALPIAERVVVGGASGMAEPVRRTWVDKPARQHSSSGLTAAGSGSVPSGIRRATGTSN